MSSPEIPELSPSVRSHLEDELGEHAPRVLEFLDQAKILLSESARGPRSADVAAYCLREAMMAVVADVKHVAPQWRSEVRETVEALREYESALPGLPQDIALDELLTRVRRLDQLDRGEGIHDKRLTESIHRRTGHEPTTVRDSAPAQYRKLVNKSNRLLHDTAVHSEVADLWREVIALLERLFTPPPERLELLDRLAAKMSPSVADAARVKNEILSDRHLRHFLSRIADPKWLYRLTNVGVTGLDNATRESYFYTVTGTLRRLYPKAVYTWLCKAYNASLKEPEDAIAVAHAATTLGATATPLLLRITQDNPHASWILPYLSAALRLVPPGASFVEDIAEVLLCRLAEPDARFGGGSDRYRVLGEIGRHLVDGVNEKTVSRRYGLLCRQIELARSDDFAVRSVAMANRSIGDLSGADVDDLDYPLEALISVWVEMAAHAKNLMTLEGLLQPIHKVPPLLRRRLHSWLLILCPDQDERREIFHIAEGIREHWPTEDDRQTVSHIHEHGKIEEAVEVWREAMGAPPDIPTLSESLSRDRADERWLRCRLWANALPDEVSASWRNAIAVLDGRFGPTESGGATFVDRGVSGYVKSPMSQEELASVDPVEACQRIASWRPKPMDFDVDARALGRTLEEVVVSAEDDQWVAAPLQLVCALQQPTYIAHYLSGVSKVLRSRALTATTAGELLDIVHLLRNPPWRVVSLGRSDFDFDTSWSWTKEVSIDLLKMMSLSGTGFSDREDEAWTVLEGEVKSSEGVPDIHGEDAHALMTAAINWRRTRALEASVAFVRWEHQRRGVVRKSVLDLVAETLDLDGLIGALCRAIIVGNMHYLAHVAPDWLARNMDRLFGKDAPPDLAEKTLELALRWARPPALTQVLEMYRKEVVEASVAGSEQAISHYLGAMVIGIAGYTSEEALLCISRRPALAHRAGVVLRRLFGSGDEEARSVTILDFWDRAIEDGPKALLPEFGWLASVRAIGDEKLATLLLRTLRKTEGRVASEIKNEVADRVAALTPSRDALEIMDLLVRQRSQFDAVMVYPVALRLLERSAHLAATSEYRRLRAALAERGVEL